jgi:geranylgeranyl diphosphate synthase type II
LIRKETRALDFNNAMQEKRNLVESWLRSSIKRENGVPETIYEAMEYSLLAGGKRLRPILVVAGCELCGGDVLKVKPLACAVEMIHTYSLIHDDLPAMDDDDFRRGKPTSHKVFGEAIAVLAGDGLLNSAFETLLDVSPFDNAHLGAARVIAKAAGVTGMIGGQVLDIENEGKKASLEGLKEMHSRKTGALITASVLAGALSGGGSGEEMSKVREFGESLGLAFQIRDDILDVIGDQVSMGKSAGSDASKGKSTYVSLLGLEESGALVKRLIDNAKESLDGFGDRGQFLKQLADSLADRKF